MGRVARVTEHLRLGRQAAHTSAEHEIDDVLSGHLETGVTPRSGACADRVREGCGV